MDQCDEEDEYEKIEKLFSDLDSAYTADEFQANWNTIGKCLQFVLKPVLRKHAVPIISKLYDKLKDESDIHTQTHQTFLQKHPDNNGYELNYVNINSNQTLFQNKRKFDYKVKNAVDFSKLFLSPKMASYQTFDEACLWTILTLIVNTREFPVPLSIDASKVRDNIRNKWAHFDQCIWDDNRTTKCFQRIQQCIRGLHLEEEEESKVLHQILQLRYEGGPVKGDDVRKDNQTEQELSLYDASTSMVKATTRKRTSENIDDMQRKKIKLISQELTVPASMRSLKYISTQLLSSDVLSKTIQFHGLRSKYGDNLLSGLCSIIRELSTSVIRVWVGYQKGCDNTPLFVAVVSENDETLSENFRTICHFQVVQRLSDEVSEEAKLCLKRETDMTFSLLEHSELHEAIVEHSEELFKSHSNLLMISASAIKSSKAGNKIETKTCIVLYVHIKGIIPLKEKSFPSNIGTFPVDVREGIVYMYNDTKLTIGCNIVNAYNQCASLGGFVSLPDGEVGCLTCWHMFVTDESKQDPLSDNSNKNVFMRSKDNQLHHFGHLIDGGHVEGDKHTIGVDVALIKVTDGLKRPVNGNFGTIEFPLLADPDQPSEFCSGEILTTPQKIAELQTTENARCKIIRYDDLKKQMYICTGVLKVSGTTSSYNHANRKWLLYNQMEIHPSPPDEEFANFGDSGALVFLVNEHTDDMWAIGMVVGGLKTAVIVTPIWAILKKFGLPMRLLSFKSQRMKKIESGMKVMQRQMYRMHNQTQQSLTEILNRLPQQ